MGVLVLGMHRSGTSAVTRVLNLLGLHAGEGVLMGAAPSNPTGHWEVEALTALNDEALDAVGGRWAAPPPPDAEVDRLAATPLGDSARQAFAGVFADANWVWKDPRLALLLPFWHEVLSDRGEVAHVVVTRDPVEVARSLHARDAMAVPYGLALWERYTRVMLTDLSAAPVFVLAFADLLAEPSEVVGELAAFLGDRGLALASGREAAIDEYLSDRHRHQRGGDGVELPTAQQALVDLLGGLRGPHPDGLGRVELPDESPNIQMAFSEHKRLSRFEEKANLYEADQSEIARLQEEISLLKEDLDARSAQATDLAEGLALTQEALAESREQAAEWEAKLLEIYERWPVRAYTALRRRFSRA